MRILITGINFSPELLGAGKYTGEMARWLAARGHDVRVVTAAPYYPEWRIAAGYAAWRYSRTCDSSLVVWRCPIWVPRFPSGARRLLHLASFAASSLPVLLFESAFWRPDILMLIAPTLACAPGVLISGEIAKARTWIHFQDLELDAALGLGLFGTETIQSALTRFESFQIMRFDRVSTISDAMSERLRRKGAPSVCLMPNWVDLEKIAPDREAALRFRQRFDIPTKMSIVLYSGSMGKKQGLDVLISTARRLQTRDDILFILCGDGPAKSGLQRSAAELGNVKFLPLQPEAALNEMLNAAALHLLPQLPGAADLVMPSKLTTALAAGGVVVATTDENSSLGRVVHAGGGILTLPEDSISLARAVEMLIDDKVEIERRRVVARQYAARHFDREKILVTFEEALLESLTK